MTRRPDHEALVIVDLQPDFFPGGPLAVAGADALPALVNARMAEFGTVVATQDWHPADHGSFAAEHPGRSPGDQIVLDGLQQTLWPTHCVQGTPGAALHPALDMSGITRVFQKGQDPTVDSYSGFFDNGGRRPTGLAGYLQARGVRALTVVGVATDYCVRFTALDALKLGFAVTLLPELCRGVELRPGDVAAALAELTAAGAQIGEAR
jgi:nicotinamidase/pyrazinamidase